MTDELLPTNASVTVGEKDEWMIKIASHFPKSISESYCFCGKKEDKLHIYNCKILNRAQHNLKY